MRDRRSVFVVALLATTISCGGAGSGGTSAASDGGTASGTASSSSSSSSGNESTTSAVPDGKILKPGPPPPAWVTTGGANVTLAPLPPKGKDFESVTCPEELRPPGAGQSQCVVYADAGGAFALATTKTVDGPERTLLLCQVRGGTDFAPSLSVEAPRAATAGAVDGQGQQLVAQAMQLADGIHWFGIRSPDGEQCPVVWDLGVADASLDVVSSVGGVTLSLAAGPSCVRLVPDGLLARPGRADGICAP